MASPILTTTADQLTVQVFACREELGQAAGQSIAQEMRKLLQEQENIRMVFAAAPSQNDMLAALRTEEGIDWARVAAFHMDEYLGLQPEAPQRFGKFLDDKLFSSVQPGIVHYISGQGDPKAECCRYGRLLRESAIDIVCLGIGENGHLAFNDPPVADFGDPYLVKVVELDSLCRQQQVNDGCFGNLEYVPTHAITLTIPALMAGAKLFCVVPGAAKRAAVLNTLRGPITAECPASILRTHPNATLYVDAHAYGDA